MRIINIEDSYSELSEALVTAVVLSVELPAVELARLLTAELATDEVVVEGCTAAVFLSPALFLVLKKEGCSPATPGGLKHSTKHRPAARFHRKAFETTRKQGSGGPKSKTSDAKLVII